MTFSIVILVVFLGVGATIVMDLWALILKLCGQSTLNFSLVGRWVGYMINGQFIHRPSIGQKAIIPAENALGWGVHYVTGIIFAFIFILLVGEIWFTSPVLWPALLFGIITVAAPYFIMQPAMGAGIAASKMPNPNKARLMSLLSHSVFGLGLYLTGLVLQPLLTYFL
ncbi:DUF2938 domain-containing protein [Providencia huaxiensis]|uniref:DUF2938 domain-containing protein n=1 Tax=Providencia TaxID=586 RepID=UPI0019D2A41A|nr:MULTISPECIES: DUF2938 domain-containing protein [Providencia]MBN6360028.1 DUF2938 domain-containing protein [Providencia huaxiensis]MCD2526866.1 DUF2938 domain-containing protein [Providencia huaxiensis]